VIGSPSLQYMNQMMRQVVAGGTGTRAKVAGYDIAGKTGTTSDYRDAWFVGYTGGFVTAVWTGKDDNTSMKKVTGGGAPAEIWPRAQPPRRPRRDAGPGASCLRGPAALRLKATPIPGGERIEPPPPATDDPIGILLDPEPARSPRPRGSPVEAAETPARTRERLWANHALYPRSSCLRIGVHVPPPPAQSRSIAPDRRIGRWPCALSDRDEVFGSAYGRSEGGGLRSKKVAWALKSLNFLFLVKLSAGDAHSRQGRGLPHGDRVRTPTPPPRPDHEAPNGIDRAR
jgi:hypothetical protein